MGKEGIGYGKKFLINWSENKNIQNRGYFKNLITKGLKKNIMQTFREDPVKKLKWQIQAPYTAAGWVMDEQRGSQRVEKDTE